MFETFAETNLFRVTDEEKYKELAKRLNVDEHWAETNNGAIRHGFKANHSVEYHDENPENDFMFFVKELQKILPDKEEFFYCEIINGKGYAILCTSHSILNLGVKEQIIYSSTKDVDEKGEEVGSGPTD